MPALVLNYFGQGAMLLQHQRTLKTRFTKWHPSGPCPW